MDLSGTPMRYYELQYMLEGIFEDLSGAEMKIGAFNMVAAISGFLWNLHFNQKQVLNPKSLVKTFDDVYTNMCEDMSHLQETTGIQIFTKVDPPS
jgi:hypothetical protein